MPPPPPDHPAAIEARRALVVTAPGGPDVLRVDEVASGAPGPGQLRVHVAASGLNFKDVYEREGIYPRPVPFVLGDEGAGTVVELGPEVTGFAVGDRVAWASAPGSHADVVLVDAAMAVAVPAEVPIDVAAGTLLQGMTAHYLVSSTYPVQPGDSVLVHAAAGGVGQLLVQLAKSRGATVIATTSTAEKAAKVEALGADVVIDYRQLAGAELAAAVRAANGGEGVQVVYDGVGRATFDASLAALRPRGLLALFGGASGQVLPFDLQRLNRGGSLFVTRPTLVHYLASRDELLWRAGEVFDGLATGGLRLEIGGRYPLSQAKQAYTDLEGRRTTGKLLFTR